jgi:hypothetical protein
MQLYKIIKYHILFVTVLLLSLITYGQTDMDAIMMNKKQLCSGFEYMHSSWDQYWEGTLKRTNENLGTVATQSVMFMPAYGITDRFNVLASASYISTNASAGTMHGMKGLQDASVYLKWIPLRKTIGGGNLTAFLVGGITAPLTNYVVDYLPLSIGMGSTNLTGRAMVDYNYRRITVTGSAAYIRRSNVRLDRTSYYDTQLHLTDEVKMPDVAQYQLRAGYRGKYLIAEAVLTNWTTLGGFDITRNNMPFPSNRMNATSMGARLKYTLKSFTKLSFLAGADATLSGRNMGKANMFNAGAFYVFYVSKKATTKK